jgi:hypothetical protein
VARRRIGAVSRKSRSTASQANIRISLLPDGGQYTARFDDRPGIHQMMVPTQSFASHISSIPRHSREDETLADGL